MARSSCFSTEGGGPELSVRDLNLKILSKQEKNYLGQIKHISEPNHLDNLQFLSYWVRLELLSLELKTFMT